MDISFHLDETEAKIYGFLEKNAHKAFTPFEIYVNVFCDWVLQDEIRFNRVQLDRPSDPRYQAHQKHYKSMQKRLEAMVKEEKISGRYDQENFYYTV